jgi:NADP-dependent 3-hydroxy acid dehydrogenase YdfG
MTTAPASLTGRRALVVGATSGIGRAIAVQLAELGCRVLVAGRRAERLAALADEKGRLVPVVLDATDRAVCATLADVATETLGGLDIVVYASGTAELAPIIGAPLDDWHAMIDINLKGYLNVVHATLPLLLANETSDLFLISSFAGRKPVSGNGVYAASKAAVNAFSESLRQEASAQGLRTTVIEPGVVGDTELPGRQSNHTMREFFSQYTENQTTLTSADIAAFVGYVLTQPVRMTFANTVLVETQLTRKNADGTRRTPVRPLSNR